MTLYKSTAAFAVATLCFFAFAADARASILAQETFDYAAGSLSGRSGGTGFLGSWPGGEVIADDMSWPENVNAGSGRMSNVNTKWSTKFRSLDVAGAFSAYTDDDTVIGKDGTTLWLAYEYVGTGDQGNWLVLADSQVDQYYGDTNIGQSWKPSSDFWPAMPRGSSNERIAIWGRRDDTTGTPSLTEANPNDRLTHMIIAQISFGAGNSDTVTVYVDEDLSTDPDTWVPDASRTDYDASFYRVGFCRADSWPGGIDPPKLVGGFDEIRFATSAYDFSTVPTFDPNIDGINGVDDKDLNLLLSDFDADGLGGGGVDGYNQANLDQLLGEFGSTGLSGSTVPEPASAMLLLLGLFGIAPIVRLRK